MEKFQNLIPYDFTIPEIAQKQKEAIERVKGELGKEYPNIIHGKEIYTERQTKSYNPGRPGELIGVFQKGGSAEAEEAIQSANYAFQTWRFTSPERRAQYLLDAAEIMKARRMEINAWMMVEAGKNFAEADADTCEGIDFLEFYAREAVRYGQDQPLTEFPGEINRYFYIPLGVGIAIPPWNFPFAIMVGITTAAIAAGNTVVMKPSSDTPKMAQILSEVMQEVGLPDGVLNFFVASGSEAGDYMVQHPLTRFISFTGSMEVGLRINELAAKHSKDQIWIKRVIAEMGGKDGIVVDSECDIDEAVQGVVTSAFGFQGQKCSACSRAIVVKDVYDEFVEKLKAAVEKIDVGPQEDNHRMGPVINKTSMNMILDYIEIGKEEGRLITGGGKVEGLDGFFLQPTVVADISVEHRLAQEEVFGPLLAVMKAEDFDHAIDIANDTIYGLTGAVYSDNKDKLDKAAREFHVGNLYFNRKCTGALVDVQPFGGFNMSGTDSKAGSRDYLQLFMQGKSISEKIK